ncbi:putative ABC transport system permease protein [Panacagrimonas perspica]|uniref:Putative ABC transport system permease protein n=1 Tax=Panacagrimonas perspica TaxID=381431 RepID=A0A4R7NY37_9GAMM|nr:ABC transporter permease [Panacagrimonas perspica]TDU25631.1 putative ABC transport system permease protein [Panacagrimonas perspica]THD03775.1 multidrug ABC transporter substrate-binding protein [Panacagrimonas perspica]
MNWPRLALANLRASPLTSLVNVVLLGLGTASIVLLLLIGEQLSSTLTRDARGIDLVIGAKGSPVQLVLSSVYHADLPTGNIPKAEADRWASDPRVARAVPLSLGDSYRGFRIVGTTPGYAALYDGQLAAGRFWKAPMEAVAGAAAAREARLQEGSHLVGAHGLVGGGHAHAGHPYRVVGVLAPTGTILDRLILTSLDSVWELHEAGHPEDDHDADHDHGHAHGHAHKSDPLPEAEASHDQEADHAHDDAATGDSEGREITALLVRYHSPLAATTLPRQINAESSLQAAAPASEITRLLQLVGLGLDGLRAFAGVLILTAAFSVFAALYGALKARRYDLAMLRCLGATRAEVLLSLLLEGLLLVAAGALLGFALGHGTMEVLGRWMAASRGVSATGWTWLPAEMVLIIGLVTIGLLATLLPAWQAYRTDVARILAG